MTIDEYLSVQLVNTDLDHRTFEAEKLVRELKQGQDARGHPLIALAQTKGFFHPDLNPEYTNKLTILDAKTIFHDCSLILAQGAQGKLIFFDKDNDETRYQSLTHTKQKVAIAGIGTSPSIIDSREELNEFLIDDAITFNRPHRQKGIFEIQQVRAGRFYALSIVTNPITESAMELYHTTTNMIAKKDLVFTHLYYVGTLYISPD